MDALDIAENADQVELIALRNQYAVVSDGLDDEVISGEIEELMKVDQGPGVMESWSVLDTYNDSQQGMIMQELESRSHLLQTIYPFKLEHSALTYNNSESTDKVYEALLMTALTTRRQGRYWLELVDSFEKLSALAVKEFFQCNEVWWTGASTNEQFKQLVEAIHENTSELEWNADPNLFNNHEQIKDAGLDFINYRRLDQRAGGLFYFGQSACGRNWFSKTEQDLRPQKIERIFRMPYADPVKLFTIPYLITNDQQKMLRAANNFSGLIFDRARLTRLLIDMEGDAVVRQEIGNVYHLASEKCN